MQTVGARRLLVSQPSASVLVALVQTADMLPDLLFGLVGGILADTFDRRWLLIVVNTVMAITATALTLLTLAGQMPPALLLIFTFLLGCGALSHINAELQLFLPNWGRARPVHLPDGPLRLPAYLSSGLGLRAVPLGLVPTFLLAALLMLLAAGTLRFWPLIDTANIDTRVAAYWPEPELVFDAGPYSGPVVVNVYTVSEDTEASFIAAMSNVRKSRLRTGATRWGLFRDGEKAHQFVELFAVASWEEHLRQHTDRLTGFDRISEEKVTALSDPPERSSHLLSVDVED